VFNSQFISSCHTTHSPFKFLLHSLEIENRFVLFIQIVPSVVGKKVVGITAVHAVASFLIAVYQIRVDTGVH